MLGLICIIWELKGRVLIASQATATSAFYIGSGKEKKLELGIASVTHFGTQLESTPNAGH